MNPNLLTALIIIIYFIIGLACSALTLYLDIKYKDSIINDNQKSEAPFIVFFMTSFWPFGIWVLIGLIIINRWNYYKYNSHE